MGRYGVVKGGKGEGDETGAERHGFGCAAHGCPLPGVFSDATDGSGDYRCWAHDRSEESSQWPYLSQGIKLNGWLFKLAERVSTMPLYDIEQYSQAIEKYLDAKGRPDLNRLQNDGRWPEALTHEPRPYWVQRLRGAAFKAAMAYVDEHWVSPSARRHMAMVAEIEADK